MTGPPFSGNPHLQLLITAAYVIFHFRLWLPIWLLISVLVALVSHAGTK